MTNLEVFLQQIINGFSNGMIIALIALGYTIVYGIVELINFAHGDLVMLGSFFALTLIAALGLNELAEVNTIVLCLQLTLVVLASAIFCALLNWLIDRVFYSPLRESSRLSQLVTAIGVSFILINLGLFWGGLPLKIFNQGQTPTAPKDFPVLVPNSNFLGESFIQLGPKDLMVFVVTLPIMLILTYFVKFTKLGTAMRAVAQNPLAAKLMGINVEQVISLAFILGGALAGVASVVYALYNNTISFQMGYRIGMDGFIAAVLGGIGNLPGAVLGGILIGIIRAMSDQYLEARWTAVVVFMVLIFVLVFRPSGILGARVKEKV